MTKITGRKKNADDRRLGREENTMPRVRTWKQTINEGEKRIK